jgi:hypothetical protein
MFKITEIALEELCVLRGTQLSLSNQVSATCPVHYHGYQDVPTEV